MTNVFNEAQAYLKDSGITITEFAKAIGFERSTVSKYLKGTYGNAGKIEESIAAYLENNKEFEKFSGKKGAAETNGNEPPPPIGGGDEDKGGEPDETEKTENDETGETGVYVIEGGAKRKETVETLLENAEGGPRGAKAPAKNAANGAGGQKTFPAKGGTIPLFFKSGDAKAAAAVCHACKEYRDTGIIIGKSGFGKSYTLRRFKKGRADVHYVECGESMTIKDFVTAIEEAAGLPYSKGSDNSRLKTIAAFFNNNPGHLLIIDEADKLLGERPGTRSGIKKMEKLRELYDLTLMPAGRGKGDTVAAFMAKDEHSAGFLLAGEPALRENLKYYLPRFASRAGNLFYEFSGLSAKEVKEYLSDFNFTAEALDAIAKKGVKTSFRALDRTLKNLFRNVEPKDTITLSDVHRAGRMMMI